MPGTFWFGRFDAKVKIGSGEEANVDIALAMARLDDEASDNFNSQKTAKIKRTGYNYSTGLVPPSGIILPFYATGTVAFLVLCLLLAWSPNSLLLHYFNPHVLAITHIAALGCGVR